MKVIIPTKELIQDLCPDKKVIECYNCGLIHFDSERVNDFCPRCEAE